MKESVDKTLKEHIIKVFDNYDDTGAEQGWQSLRKKYPAKPVRRIILWWSSAAAIVAIAGTLLFLNTSTNDDKALTANKNVPKAVSSDTATNKTSDLTLKTTVQEDAYSQNNQPAVSAQKPVKAISTEVSDKVSVNEINVIDIKTALAASKKEPTEIRSVNIEAQSITSHEPETARHTEEKLRPHTDEPLIQNGSIEPILAIPGSNSFHGNNYQRKILPEKEPDLIEKKRQVSDSKFELSFYAGPFFNYAEGSSNPMNMGAGVSSGISLTKRFTLIAGVALANNKLVFNNEVPVNSYAAYLSNSAMDQKAPSSLVASAVPHISKLEAQLLNLDIPINIKYSISRKPDKVFITAGLSSFTYLNEAYHYSFNDLNRSNSFSSSRNEVINKNFGKFDLAQTLNLSFGLTHTAKVQSFVLEPFIKYPLGALGTQNIRFGSAGINFKLSIHPAGNRTKETTKKNFK